MTNADIDVPGLGRLSRIPDSPPGEEFWSGSFHYADDGTPQTGAFFLSVSADTPEPPAVHLEFARRMLGGIEGHIASARALLKQKLAEEPQFFGVDAEGSARYLEKGDAFLPFAAPEPTFYEPERWQIRFAESPLPLCETFGVSVVFRGTTPTQIEDLSESTLID